MNATTKRATRRLAASLAIATALAAGGAQAGSTTYYQIAGTNDCSSVISLDGLPSNTEITSTPQLAFPGITLDDIPERASFFTTMYGEGIPGGDTIAVGMHEKRHVSDNHVDKIALQFVVYDNSATLKTKGVVLVLTNGDNGDGVYVQMFGRFNKGSNFVAENYYYEMNSETGNLSWRNWLQASERWDGSWTSGDGAFQAKGIRIHGLNPTNSANPAFLNTTLDVIKDCAFVAGFRQGRSLEKPATNNWAAFKTCWTNSANDKLEKIVMQFMHPTLNNRTAVISLTESGGNVYATQVLALNNPTSTQTYAIDVNGSISVASGTSQSMSDPPPYPVNELFLLPPCVKKTPTKVWSSGDPLHPLKLDDIKDGVFGSRFFGAWVTDKNYYRYTPNSATGTIEAGSQIEDASGSITNMVVWFEIPEGSKRVKVMFEYREDGIYATGIDAKSGSNASSTFVETYEGDGYALCDLRVTVPTVHKWTLDADNTWSTLRDGDTLESDEVVRITVTDPDAVLTVDESVEVAGINFVDGTGATLNIAEGQTVTAESISGCVTNILNSGTVVKTGEGTATWPFNNDSTGVTIVSNGTLKVASVTGIGSSHAIRVASGATFDVNGKNYESGKYYGVTATVRLEEGANLANTQGHTGYNYNNYEVGHLILDGDATATAAKDFGINAINYTGAQLDLGTHTLTVTGGKEFMLHTTTVTGTGKVVVESGNLVTYGTTGGNDWTLETGAGGTLTINGSAVTVGNFVNGGSVSGNATLTVNGTLTPGIVAINKLTLADGATVKATGTAQEVSTTFAASGVITVDASEITAETLHSGDVAVLTVPAAFIPSGATWPVSSEQVAGTRAKWRTDAGGETKTLYLARSSGLMITLR